METAVVNGNLEAQRRGTYFAFTLAMTAILGGIWLISRGMNVTGLASIVTAVAALSGAFIYSKYEQRKERERKAAVLDARRKN